MEKRLVEGGSKLRPEDFEVCVLEGESFSAMWPQISEQLDLIKHVWWDRWTKEEIFCAVLQRRLQCWGIGPPSAHRLVVFSQILRFENVTTLQVMLAFGQSLELALPVLAATLEKFARSAGCGKIEVVGRAGWEKLLAPYGMRLESVILSKRVSEMRVH